MFQFSAASYDILPYTYKDFLVRFRTKMQSKRLNLWVVELFLDQFLCWVSQCVGEGRGCGFACNTDAPNLPQVVLDAFLMDGIMLLSGTGSGLLLVGVRVLVGSPRSNFDFQKS